MAALHSGRGRFGDCTRDHPAWYRSSTQDPGDELSGQILAVRTGALKSSIDLQIDQDNDRISATVSSNSRYASVHEYGFVGTVAVKASLRRITEAFGHPISEKTINVGPYRRRMELPERSFMRSALEDMDPAIRDEVEAALLEALTV